jgi:hypothetical protein
MPNLIRDLPLKRRIALAWGLIAVALLCQVSSNLYVVNIFVMMAAVAFHEILVRPPHRPWEKWFGQIAAWAFFLVFFVLALLHRLPDQKVIYIIAAAFITPFIVWAVATDVKYLRGQRNLNDSQ